MLDQKIQIEEDIVSEVVRDFERRRDERLSLERQWELNLNYLAGNQYCELGLNGEVEEEEKYYYWQDRNVYNHIAPIIDTRIAKLTRARPIMSVRAAGGEEGDIRAAKLTTAILNSTFSRLDLNMVISEATSWSESCGTCFYEVVWDKDAGKYLGEFKGEPVYEGDVSVKVVPPFEIFPDCICSADMSACKSIIHARAMHVDDVEKAYGVRLSGGDMNVFSLSSAHGGVGKSMSIRHDNVLVIERFERPTKEYPEGRVIAVAENTLLYVGALPFINGVEGRRDFPFIRQIAIANAGCFFGTSMIERVIPVQRAFNAVKNRKQEFLNRISMGVITVEDGSVDTDELAEEGLSPGKVIVYRQGSNPPSIMNTGSVPIDFTYEEERLESEFVLISGVSEFSRTSNLDASLSSGVALQLLIDQDDTRLLSTAENLKRAVKLMGKHIIRLFKQFAKEKRIMRIAGVDGKIEAHYFTSNDITSDDVVFDTENELSYSPAQKKSAVYELIQAGLLNDKSGVMSERTKAKVLDILGFGSVAGAQDIERLHRAKADGENLSSFKEPISPDSYDDHSVHIAEHTRFLLSGESDSVRANSVLKQNALNHLNQHEIALNGAGKQLRFDG